MSVVVNTESNGNYEPSEGEIIEYGKWLGMKLPEDNPFLWIAREGLKAPLPENWKACQSDKEELYYFNFKTGQSIWDHPMDEHFKELFKAEKQNPTPRSVAAGAMRRGDLSPASKQDGKAGKKKSAKEKGSKEMASLTPVETSERAQHQKKPQQLPEHSKSTEAPKEATANMQPLKSLKVKKELPKEMRIEFGELPAEDKITRQQPLSQAAKLAQPVFSTPPELRFTKTQSDSSEELSPKQKPKAKAIPEGSVAPPGDVPAAGGGSGLKSLRILSENNNRSSPPNETISPDAAVKSADTEEKEKIIATAKEEIENLRSQMAKQRQMEEEVLAAENVKAIKNACERFEMEKQSKIKEAQKKSEEALREEQRTIEDQMKTAIEHARKDMFAQKSSEIRRLKDNYKEQLEQEKKKLSEDMAFKLDVFAKEQRQEHDAKKDALSQRVRDSEKMLENELQHFSSSLIRAYEESYASYAKSISTSQNDFALRSVQQKVETQRELDTQLSHIRSEHENAIGAEKQMFLREMDELRAKHSTEKSQAVEAANRDLEQLKSDFAKRVQEQKADQEKDSIAEVSAALRASHQQELELLKTELRQKAEEELKAAMTEFAQEQKWRMSVSPSQRDSVSPQPKPTEEERSSSLQVNGNEAAGAGRPPSLDRNLLRSGESGAGDGYAALRDNQAKDIKTAVTEALREMFAESPFTLPSPGVKSVTTSPSRQDAATVRRPSLSGPAAAEADIANGPLGLTRSQKHHGFPFPVSFQDQRELVEGERQRVREGRRFVETQRKNLEERRQQLRRTRHQWKQDVMAAKEEGVRSSSKRGQLLNKVRLALEEQAKGLEHDESILHESMGWLQSKEQRLVQLENQIEEQERLRALGDNSTVNCSVDTAALVTGYFKPQRGSVGGPGLGDFQSRRMSQSLGTGSANNFTPFESPATTPVFSSALSRIERRLDEVTSLINLQKVQSQSVSPSHQAPGGRKISLSTPTTAQSQTRHRSSGSNSKAADAGRENHVDPW